MCVKQRMGDGGRGEGSPLSVWYSIIWPCGFYRVVTWRTSPTDGIHFLDFTFPWTPCFTPNFFWLSPTLVFSSRGDTGERLPLCLNCKDVTFWSAYRKIKCSLCAACLSVMCCKQQKKNLWRCWQEVSFKQQTTHLFEYVNQIKSM